ncbi:MAG: mRNA surveillance protein pelota [Candidatus Methanomethylicia archaeon]
MKVIEMRILKLNEKGGELQLRIDDDDDLWLLYHIIEKGDKVYANTTREIKFGDKSIRKLMYIGIDVIKVEYQPFTNRLRINGIIIYHPEKYENYGFIGEHHTISIKPSDEITIVRNNWPKYIIRQIEESCRKRQEKILIVSIDDEEIAVGIITGYGVEIIFEKTLSLPSKREAEIREEKLREEIKRVSDEIIGIILRKNLGILIITGLNYLRERLLLEIKGKIQDVKKDVTILSEDTSSGGIRGINETLKRESLAKALKRIKILEDERIMEEYLKILAKNPSKVTYGIEETTKAAKLGAVDVLLISSNMLKTYGDIREAIEEIIKELDNHNGRMRIISDLSEAGRELNGFGGIAAILRYKIEGG